MKKMSVLLGMVLMALLITVLLSAASSDGHAQTSVIIPTQTPPGPPQAPPQGPPARSTTHRPAIHPTKQGTPGYSQADVEVYLQSDMIAQDAKAHAMTHKISFQNTATVEAQLGESYINVSSQVCVVEYDSPTPISLKIVIAPSNTITPKYHKYFDVFDAATGDELSLVAQP